MSENKTHWLQSPNKNYLGHWDLPEDGLTLTIKSAKWEVVENPKTGAKEEKRIIRWVEDYKPMICNQTNANSILKCTGVRYMEDSNGKQVFLFIGSTKYMGDVLPCIRIKNETIDKPDEELMRILGYINKCKNERSIPGLEKLRKNLLDNGKGKPEYLEIIKEAENYLLDLEITENDI